MATSNKSNGLIKTLGFTGVAAVLGMTVSLGKVLNVIETNSISLKEDQRQTQEVIEEVKVQQQEITDMDRRITRLEDKK